MEDELVKEYHFHTYFHQRNEVEIKKAQEFHIKIQEMVSTGYFTIVPSKINLTPIGPHAIGSFETWVPIEFFAEAYNFFLKNRGDFSILIHTLTVNEIHDHTINAAWIGQPIPLDLSVLKETLEKIPLQYPELKLGYSA